ncbi:MAG: MucR family transcriptional regulator, partial [Actinomycetes bacterium]
MLHPVGDLPAAVYWRRRVMVLVVLLAVLGGIGWLGVALVRADGGTTNASSASVGSPAPPPALERVVPSVSAVATPTPPEVPAEAPPSAASPAAPAP